jgi:hypothetical protein
MSGKKAFVSLAVITTAGFLGTAAATWSSERNDKDPDAIVIPCSLYGINPVLHPNIFSNPVTAKAFGFVRSRDGTWHVKENCIPHSHSN